MKRGYSHRAIAQALEKHHSSISREIKDNSVRGRYIPLKAHLKVKVKRIYSKYRGMKIRSNVQLENYVAEKVQKHWSPEEISGRIRNIDTHVPYVSALGIYKYLYSAYGQSLCNCLYSRRYQKKKRRGKKHKKTIIQHRIFIDKRPQVINERKRFGDWEGDTLGAIKTDQERIAGMAERRSRFFVALKVPQLKYTVDGFKYALSPYRSIVRSTTLDNGVENTRHQELETKTYFCHPYASWEKGGIENTFMRLRRFIPKGSSLKNYTNQKISSYIKIMNNTPRKCLQYRTPNEVFKEQLLLTRCRT